MKRHFLTMGLMLCATLSFIACDPAEISKPDTSASGLMKIFATSEATRTTNDGMNTLWASGDPLTVWHALAGTTDYVKDGNTDGSTGTKFTTTDTGASATFEGSYTGTINPDIEYDWYVLYPNKPALVSPEGNHTEFIGTHNVGLQFPEQAEFNSTSHIAGTEYLVYGKASAVKGSTMPSVQMKHISSLVKLVITNNSGAAIRPHTVIFTAPESISGQHAINLTVDPMIYTPQVGKSFNYVWTNIKGGAELAVGDSMAVYFAVKPFTAEVGDTLLFEVNGYQKALQIAAETSFEAGKIKTITFNYNRNDADLSGEYVIGGDCPGGFYLMEGYSLQAKTYTTGNNTVNFGKKVRKEGDVIYYDDDMRVGSNTTEPDVTIDNFKYIITKVTDGEYAGMYTIQRKSDNQYWTAGSSFGGNSTEYLESPTVDSYWDITAHGDYYYFLATKSTKLRFFKFSYNNANYPRFIACAYTATGNYETGLYPVSALQADPLPRLEVSDIVSIPYSGVTDAKKEIKILNNTINQWNASVDFTGCVTAASISGNVITYSVDANSSSEAGTGTIVVSLSKNDQKIQATINVSQDPMPSAYFKKVASDKTDWTGEYLLVAEVSDSVGYVLYTNDTFKDGSVNTEGAPSFKVDITKDGILATETVKGQGLIFVQKYSDDGGTDGNALYNSDFDGYYNMFVQKKDTQTNPKIDSLKQPCRLGIGTYSNNIANNMKFNSNSWYSRFALSISYDTVSESMHIASLYKKVAANPIGYLRFDTLANDFGWQAHSTSMKPDENATLSTPYEYGEYFVGDYRNNSCNSGSGWKVLKLINIQFYELEK